MVILRLVLAAGAVAAAAGTVISDIRAAIARKDFEGGERIVAAYRARHGVTPEMLEALSWLGRGALAAGELDRADTYAAETYELAAGRPVDGERHLPVAVGAAIEVRAQVMAARGERGGAVAYLQRELEKYGGTSIRARIQKNINLLSLEGKPAPPLEAGEWLGPKPEPLAGLKGKQVLLFFWAHWCGDCKAMAPALAKLVETYGPQGLVVIGPTQRYGYVDRGEEAAPGQETPYIDRIRRQFYPSAMPVPLSEENFRVYGASTTPTLVLIDRAGIVRLYHPGRLSYEEIASRLAGAR